MTAVTDPGDLPRPAPPPPGSAWGAPVFVWGVWALMVLAALAFVGRHGSNVPNWDEWDLVPTLTGAKPITLSWLWSQHNEHRIPLPRLILLALIRPAGPDFRAGMFASVLLLGALAFAMIRVASRLRGRMSCSDAFFPLVLLHWGHGANFLWGWQIAQVTPVVLAGTLLLLIAGRAAPPSLRGAVAAGVCLLLLPLCGAYGVALVPALAPWLGYAAVLHWRSGNPHGKRDGLPIAGLAAAALSLVALYFVGYQRVPYVPVGAGLRASLTASVQFLSLSFGPATTPFWKFAGWGGLGLLLFSAAALLAVGWGRSAERPRALGLLLFLGAMASLALGVGWGRPFSALDSRYALFSVPALCGAYLVWSLYGPPVVGYLMRIGLFVAACVVLWPNNQFGVRHGRHLRSRLAAIEQEVRDGVPGYLLIRRHASYLHPQHQLLTEYLPLLRRAGVGCFQSLRDDPDFREVSLPLVPTALNEMKGGGGIWHGTGDNPYLVFALEEPRYVCGVRLRYSYSNEEALPPWVQILWKRAVRHDPAGGLAPRDPPAEEEVSWTWGPTGNAATWAGGPGLEKTVLIWVCDTVEQLRVRPGDRPCVFRISELTLLVPPADRDRRP